jgi:Fur family ferric uptake transcriptional regulator
MSHCHTLIAELRRQGYRLTPQREMIVEAIAHAGRHVTVEEIFEQVQARAHAVNVATVYRTLDLLVELGLVSRADLRDGQVTYATLRHGPHCHLVCRNCGQVIEADHDLVEPLEEQLQAQYGFTADLHHFAIPGLCTGCQSRVHNTDSCHDQI